MMNSIRTQTQIHPHQPVTQRPVSQRPQANYGSHPAASAHRNHQPADCTGVINAQAELLTSIYGHDEHHQDSTTDLSLSNTATGHPQKDIQQASIQCGTTPADLISFAKGSSPNSLSGPLSPHINQGISPTITTKSHLIV